MSSGGNTTAAALPPLAFGMMTREEFRLRWARSEGREWYTAWAVLLMSIASVANFYELSTILRTPKLRGVRIYRIVLAISSADFIFGTWGLGYFGIRLALGNELSDDNIEFHWEQCLIFAPPCLIGLGWTLTIFAVAAYDRYRAICGFEYKKHNWKLTDRQLVKPIIAGGVFSIFLATVPFAGIGQYALQNSGQYCMPDFQNLPIFFMCFAVLATSMLCVVYFYFQVFKVIAKAAALKQNGALGKIKGGKTMDISQEIQAARKLLVLVIFFVVCWTPCFLVILLQAVGVEYFYTASWPARVAV